MSHFLTLPVMGASLLLSVAAGIHLGETTIGLVNPLYFQGPAVHPRDRGAAIDESRLSRRGDAYAGLYGWEQGHAALAAECPDCEGLAASDAFTYSAAVPYFGSFEETNEPVPEQAEDPYAKVIVPPGEEKPLEPGERVLRYAYYPLEAEQGMGGPEEPVADDRSVIRDR